MCSSVKIINHHRVLILYIYEREKILHGSRKPEYIIFHDKKQHLTLENKEDGTIAWRTASIDNLFKGYGKNDLIQKGAFLTANDRTRIENFFGDSKNEGIYAMIRAQQKISNERSIKKQLKRERKILDRMRGITSLPRGLKSWIHKNIMPAYFFYDYCRNAKETTGVCSSCGKEITLDHVKHNQNRCCPYCKRELVTKSRGRSKRIRDVATCQTIKKLSENELVIRILKVIYSYNNSDIPEKTIYESARVFVSKDDDGKVHEEYYYNSYTEGQLTSWKTGRRPVYFMWGYNFEADICGHVYCRNLSSELRETPWMYCPIEMFYCYFQIPMEMPSFLSYYVRHPQIEHLVKVGFYELVSDLIYRAVEKDWLDEEQNRTHRLLKVEPEDIDLLKKHKASTYILEMVRRYCKEGIRDKDVLLNWQLRNGVDIEVIHILQYMTVHKMIRYLDQQYALLKDSKTPYGGVRYNSMEAFVQEYRDYLEMCVKENYDMSNTFVLYPRNLQNAHDKVAKRIKIKADEKMRRDFDEAYRKITKKLDFERNGLKIIYPQSPEEIVKEGQTLHHCVGSYVDRVANKECIILFLRNSKDEDKPFYTMEIKQQSVAQVRGMKNGMPTPDVQKFVEEWEQNVLRPVVSAA